MGGLLSAIKEIIYQVLRWDILSERLFVIKSEIRRMTTWSPAGNRGCLILLRLHFRVEIHEVPVKNAVA